MILESVSIKHSKQLNEKWVQDFIAEHPTILGLGDLDLKDKERMQPSAGRLDILLQEPETLKRYEVEIQLGSTDESHIIRTIEYWDIERKRYPQYEHAAVIVAEDITSRFLNVISLFNGTIPLIALKMTAYKVNDEYALTFVKVLDEMTYGLVDEDESVSPPTDRDFWETKGSEKTLAVTDRLLELVNTVEAKAALRYNKHYIGLGVDGSAMNFVTFRPRKAHVIMTVKLPKDKEIDDLIETSSIETLPYDVQWREYRFRIDEELEEKQREILQILVKRARDNYGKGA
jgi:hypothetical protein